MLMTLLLYVIGAYRLISLCRIVICGLLLNQKKPSIFLSSGLGRGSHDDVHLLWGKLELDRCVPSILYDFVKEVFGLLSHDLGKGFIVLTLIIFEVLVALVLGPIAATAAAMIFLEQLKVVLVDRTRDHHVSFLIAFVIDL